jgi:hypothetical protein
MARFRGRHGQPDRFQVSHFAHQDTVRVFPQRGAKRRRERERHRADFALVDQALLGFVDELDRVFHREDVAELGFVQVVDHRGQRGGLARARRAGHQHHATRLERELPENLRRIQLLERQNLGWNRPEHRTRAAVLIERIHPEARQPVDLEREVHFQELFVVLALGVVHDVVHHGVHRLVVQRLDVDAAHVAVDTDHGRQPRGQVQVRCLVLYAERQQLSDIHKNPFNYSCLVSQLSPRLQASARTATIGEPRARASASTEQL